jgi:nitroreductase
MDFFEVAFTTPAIRRFSEIPVDTAMIERILETANMAPSSSNAQPWQFVVVRAAPTKRAIQSLYGRTWRTYKERALVRERSTLSARAQKAIRTGDEFAASLVAVPVHIVVFLDRLRLRAGRDSTADGAYPTFGYGSVFPAVELLMLAARALGLGSAMTTMLSPCEAETKVLLGVPEGYQLIALVPIGYPKDGFVRPFRKSVWARVHDEQWDRSWTRSQSL